MNKIPFIKKTGINLKIKHRIILFAENQKIRKKDFFQSIEMDPSSFTGSAKDTPINSTALKKIVELYGASPEWLLTGRGEMLREPPPEPHREPSQEELKEELKEAYKKLAEAEHEAKKAYKLLAEERAKKK